MVWRSVIRVRVESPVRGVHLDDVECEASRVHRKKWMFAHHEQKTTYDR